MTLIVDTHVHVYRSKAEGRRAKGLYDVWEYGNGGSPRFAAWDGDEDDALAAMAKAGASFAAVTSLLDHPVAGDPAADLVAFNEWTVSLAARNPGMLACLAVDPRCLPVPDLVAHVRKLAEGGGVAGIKIHPPMQGLRLHDEALWPLFELCVDLDLRVIAHSGPSQGGPQLGEPDAFRPILAAFPALRIALAHLGGAAWRQSAALAHDYGVYFDLCEVIEWLGAERAPSPAELVELIRAVGVDRVMTGSDFPWYDIARTVQLVRSLPGLEPHEVDALLGKNALSFFGLPVPPAAP